MPNETPSAESAEGVFTLPEIIGAIWEERFFVIATTTLITLVAIVVAVFQTEVYRAEVLLAPADLRQPSNPLIGELGSAASLLGVGLDNQPIDRVDTAIAIINSRDFSKRFILKHNVLPQLFPEELDLEFVSDNQEPSELPPAVAAWSDDPPSDWEAFKKFNRIRSVTRDRSSGLITLAVEWHDPALAAQWANWLVEDVNELVKQEELEEALGAISYLQEQLEKTQLVEMQRVFYQLIESQTQIVMLADVRDDYIFRVIDPAVIPEERIRPKRTQMTLVGALIGFLFSAFIIFVRRNIGSVKPKL